MKSTDVRFWDVRRNKSSKTVSYEIRWIVGGISKSRTRRTKALAESFLSDLRQAAKRGEAFDVETGLPTSMLPREVPVTWYELARTYIKAKWPSAAGETRKSTLDALVTVTPVLVSTTRGAPDATLLRRALLHYGLNPPRWKISVPTEEAAALKWLADRSLPVTDLAEADVIRSALNAIAVTMAGRPAAPTTVARKRAVFYNALKYAVKERKLLEANPIDQVDWKAPEKTDQVDRSVVANPAQVRQLLAFVTYVGPLGGRGTRLRAMYACMYYGGLRPSEAAGLRRQDCELPDLCACVGDCSCGLPVSEWGRLTLTKSRPGPGRLYTDSGQTHDDKGLKRRPVGEKRVVPIPPELVRILVWHLGEFGAADDGRLFHTSTGGTVSASAVWRFWRSARVLGLSPEQEASPLVGRPYDLRHACATLLLNAGVPPKEVARRLGHSVEVLWKVYAGCLDGDEERINRMIEKALAA